jgi:hypothetical protein
MVKKYAEEQGQKQESAIDSPLQGNTMNKQQ